jgi:CRP/FNR family cyclic AMP-dependent transcriptional regulator
MPRVCRPSRPGYRASVRSGTVGPAYTGFLGELGAGHLEALRSRGWRRRFGRGAILFEEGGSSEQVMIMLTGRVKISHFTADGREIILAVRGPGELLGELSAIDSEPRSATALAAEPVEALVLTVEDFQQFVASTPRAAMVLLTGLVRRLREADRKRVEFAAYDTVGRVALRLLDLAREFGEPIGPVKAGGAGANANAPVRITLPLSQQELAGLIGASREAVSKALQHLRKRGWIETQRRGISILDPDALYKRAMI